MLFDYFRYAFRSLRLSPGFSSAAVLSLAIGIGGSVAMFSLVNAVVLKPLAYTDPDRLVLVTQIDKADSFGSPIRGIAPIQFIKWRKGTLSFESIAVVIVGVANITGERDPETLGACKTSAGFFETLGVKPQLGRWFMKSEEQRGAPDVVILSDGLWRRRFSADPGIIGRKIVLSGIPHEVIGVATSDTWRIQGRQLHTSSPLPDRTDIYLPLRFTTIEEQGDSALVYTAIARLKRGSAAETARAELQLTIPDFIYTPNRKYDARVRVTPLQSAMIGDTRKAFFVLLAAVGFVLLIVCVNVANLMLVRTMQRGRELGIRVALGASRRQVVAQSLAESSLLSIVGTALGLALASWVTELVVAWAPAQVARMDETKLDSNVVVFAAALCVGVALLCGFLPAWRISKLSPLDAMQAVGRGATEGPQGRGLRDGLVGFEVALGTVLAIGAGLLLASFERVLSVPRGFRTDNVLTVPLSLPPATYASLEQQKSFFRRVKEEVISMPGVQRVAAISLIPLTLEPNNVPPVKEGFEAISMAEMPTALWSRVSADYFEAMDIRLESGRLFQDEGEKEPVAVISESAAKTIWPGEHPIGKRFRHYFSSGWLRVVGVVGDVRSAGLDRNPPLVIYRTWPDRFRQLSLVVRTATSPRDLIPALREKIWKVDPGMPVPEPRTMSEVVSNSVAQRRFQTMLIAVFAGIALLLAAIGTYGVVAYAVLQRRREIGIRIALGADPREIRDLMLGRGMAPVAAGLTAGIIAAIFVSRFIAGLLFEVRTLDPTTFLIAPLLLAFAGALPCYIAATRASRTDPSRALQLE